MGSEGEREKEEDSSSSTTPPQLPLFSLPPLLRSPEHSGTLTPPLHTSASVPFQWEEHPGKPFPCTALALPSTTPNDLFKSLELPPRLLNEAKFTKTPSPTTVLEGPYNPTIGRAVLESSSFRFLRKRPGSFDGVGSLSFGGSRGSSPDRGLLGAMVLSSSNNSSKKEKGLFGSWRKRGGISFKGSSNRSEVHGGNFVFPTLSDDGSTPTGGSDGGAAAVKVARISRKRSLLGLSRAKSHLWATIYGAFKQVIPRRSTKWKKDGL